MTRKATPRSEQLEFDWEFLQRQWDYYQRQKWIDEAVLTPGVGKDGTTVMPDKMRRCLHIINNHYGDNRCSWPSQETIAKLMDCGLRTVVRTVQALVDKCLLIVTPEPCANGERNVYRIVFTEVQLLEPTRRRAYLQLLFTGQVSAVVTEASAVVTEASAVVTEASAATAHELITNSPKNRSKNSPPLATQSEREPEPDPWEVVVSDLLMFGMDRARDAVTAARTRELTVDQVNELIKRWERLRARQRGVTVGWLYRWLMGVSRPPDESESTPATTQARVSLTSEATRTTSREIQIRKDLIKRKIFGEEQDRIVNELLQRSQVAQPV